MTTIAWKGDFLVADTQLTWDKHLKGISPLKIRVLPNGIIIAGAGLSKDTVMAERYFSTVPWEGAGIIDVPKLKSYESILVHQGQVYWTEEGLLPQPVAEPYYAIGSGWKFAISAMVLGLSAEESVRHASVLDIYTNDTIQIVNIRGQEQEQQAKTKRPRAKRQA